MEKIMKKLMLQIGLMVGLVIVLAVVSANAQTPARYKAEIPFDFNIGQKTFQAGDYFIALSNSNILSLEDGQGNNLLTKFVSPNETAEATKMIFKRDDNQYFLAKIVSPDFGAVRLKTNGEKQMAKKQNSQTVSVNLTNPNK
jgi:hypothetical protein